MPSVQHMRGTRAALDALANAGGLLPFQIYVLTDEQRIAVAFTERSYRTFSPDAPLYPRAAISRSTVIGLSGHSFSDAGWGHAAGKLGADGNTIPDHGGILLSDIWGVDLSVDPDAIPYTFLPFSSEAARYAMNGPERTASYDGPLWVAPFGSQATGRMWDPGTTEWTEQRNTLVAYASEAAAAGRAYMVLPTLWPPQATSGPEYFEDINQKTQRLREEIEAAVPGFKVWVCPRGMLFEYALQTYGTSVYGGDALHPRRPDESPTRYTTWAFSRMDDMFMTQERWDTTGDPAELADLTDKAWELLTSYEWCGMGGAEVITATPDP
ncbi:hypothetical protein [Paracoccus seriniphilus]|uniref:SGNH hydrolase-type esterase domain-containing protein n=1 Tax=Paracoccus seriniphilus TaxID=184748 RepID=A0A239Q2B4_9RHOB|nr:hypothetical protein [Paracoccus seriniphilus]SNT76701.1 hypothetical protein SAMN05444959_1258 [Paracoccus seriniphilus]